MSVVFRISKFLLYIIVLSEYCDNREAWRIKSLEGISDVKFGFFRVD